MAFTYGEPGYTYGSSPRDYTYRLPHLAVKAQIVPCPGQWYGSNDVYGQISRRYDGCPYPIETLEVRAKILASGYNDQNLNVKAQIRFWEQGGRQIIPPDPNWTDTMLHLRGRIQPSYKYLNDIKLRAKIESSPWEKVLDVQAFIVQAAHLNVRAHIAEFLSNTLLLGNFDVFTHQDENLLATFNVNPSSAETQRTMSMRAFIKEARTSKLAGVFHVADPNLVMVDTQADNRMRRPIMLRAAIS